MRSLPIRRCTGPLSPGWGARCRGRGRRWASRSPELTSTVENANEQPAAPDRRLKWRSNSSVRIDRRRLLIFSAGVMASPAVLRLDALAQDATPAAAGADPRTLYGPVKGNRAYKLAFMQVFPDNTFWQTM